MAWPGGVRARRGMSPFQSASRPAEGGRGTGGWDWVSEVRSVAGKRRAWQPARQRGKQGSGAPSYCLVCMFGCRPREATQQQAAWHGTALLLGGTKVTQFQKPVGIVWDSAAWHSAAQHAPSSLAMEVRQLKKPVYCLPPREAACIRVCSAGKEGGGVVRVWGWVCCCAQVLLKLAARNCWSRLAARNF